MTPTAWMYVRAVSGFRPLTSSRENTEVGRGSLALQVKTCTKKWTGSAQRSAQRSHVLTICRVPTAPTGRHCPHTLAHPSTPTHLCRTGRPARRAATRRPGRPGTGWRACAPPPGSRPAPAAAPVKVGAHLCQCIIGTAMPRQHLTAAPLPSRAALPAACRSTPCHLHDSTQPPTFLRPTGSGSSEP